MSVCHGNGEMHCCNVNGKPCKYVSERIVSGRRWACLLFVELGDWSSVHKDERYITDVKSHWMKTGTPDCGDWIGPGCCFGSSIEDKDVFRTYVDASNRYGTPVKVKQFWKDKVI